MTALIRIGNSQGVRIPKAIIEQAHLEDKELKFKVTDDGLLIQPVKKTGMVGKSNLTKLYSSNLQIMKTMNGWKRHWLKKVTGNGKPKHP